MTQDVLPQIIAGASGVTKRYVTDADDYVWFWGWWRMSLLDIWRRKLRQQQLANILIYLWILMLFGLVLGFIYWLIN